MNKLRKIRSFEFIFKLLDHCLKLHTSLSTTIKKNDAKLKTVPIILRKHEIKWMIFSLFKSWPFIVLQAYVKSDMSNVLRQISQDAALDEGGSEIRIYNSGKWLTRPTANKHAFTDVQTYNLPVLFSDSVTAI